MKKLGFLVLSVVGLLFAEEFKIPTYTDIITKEKVDCTEVYMKLQNNEKIDCDIKPGMSVDTRLKIQNECECKRRIYQMPGGKGDLNRILDKTPRDVGYDEGMIKRAKARYNKSLKDLDKAKKELEIATESKNTQKIEKAKENLQEKERDVELYKAKVVDLEARKKEAEKKEK
ncbi:TPA: hypothetical protein RPW15_001490 [Campylobacter fetus subsp. venerealis]|uniref:hypothetical protein n=1 Tax=Campylobacter sputorum TaxID=206 RepID=UPI00187B03A2|nr:MULTISPECIES: hypothetical protein [unclassified Campylobacter]HDX6281652.1 hypothetical protein [Campylobacter fetus subsp. venerealis]MBE7358758.1 hypothetical protein [Campylobacter sp. RM11302]MBF6678555.1 hypothetical protein [Campylobacter sp. RM11259]HDX6283683.1 hypothetical protein [Campylobacter fetus subsp. venerealis]HDX6285824.1 hypothetical protein [Campylobacter fetus subsp. venerealis]